jgi:hypothetical protein
MKQHIELTGYGAGRPTTVGSLTGNLIELLSAMRNDGRSLIALVNFDDHRYVQFYVDRQGDVMGEVISNLNIGELTALSPEDEQALRDLGFQEPAYGPRPNWWFHALSDQDFTELNAKMVAAIYDVLGELPTNTATVATWPAKVPEGWTDEDVRENHRVYVEEGTGDLDD